MKKLQKKKIIPDLTEFTDEEGELIKAIDAILEKSDL